MEQKASKGERLGWDASHVLCGRERGGKEECVEALLVTLGRGNTAV